MVHEDGRDRVISPFEDRARPEKHRGPLLRGLRCDEAHCERMFIEAAIVISGFLALRFLNLSIAAAT